MKKVKLEIVGLSYSQTQAGAYALVLGEASGRRRLPIIIGGFEAQAIAIILEKMTPTRPLTHDLFKTFAETFDINVSEVIIYNVSEGVYYAKLMCGTQGNETEIDARTSDAIALAVRFNCPIYTYEFIIASSGVVLEDETSNSESNEEDSLDALEIGDALEEDYKGQSTEELKALLASAEEEERYEVAARIRDELNKRKKS
jgi:bifunctional DNase/RNase